MIGLGRHTQDVYFPVLERNEVTPRIGCVIEVESRAAETERFLATQSLKPERVVYLSEADAAKLNTGQVTLLAEIVARHGITGAIIATPPERHLDYALWAASLGLHILVDKPLTTRERVLYDESEAEGLVSDYQLLLDAIAARPPDQRGVCLISTQRRYHPAWLRMRALISEITDRTGCPVTSINAEYSDGEWRLPHDVLNQHYHPYMLGFGILSHSGYHLIDSVIHLIRAGVRPEKPADTLAVSTLVVRPVEQLSQIGFADYRHLFGAPAFDARNNFDELTYRTLAAPAGEMDAFCTAQIRRGGDTMTTATIQLQHNSFCHRGWVDTGGQNLYQGNGRLRHESYTIRQGPFQLIRFLSFQASKATEAHIPETGPGGKNHVELQVFRNRAFFGDDDMFRRYEFADLDLELSVLGSHLESAKRLMMREFLDLVHGVTTSVASGLRDHDASIRFLSAMYRSAARHLAGQPGLVEFPFTLERSSDRAQRNRADMGVA